MEILVVVGILVILISLSLGIGVSTYTRSTFFSERDMVVQLLQSVRSRAMNNVTEQPHGIKLDKDGYLLFRGTEYDPEGPYIDFDELVARRPGVFASGTDEIIFEQLSGRLYDYDEDDGDAYIVLSSDIKTATITINYEGTIHW